MNMRCCEICTSKSIFTVSMRQPKCLSHNFNRLTRTLTVHQVIHFPSLIEDQIFPLFEVVQVGMKKANLCMILDLPKFVYKNNAQYFPIDQLNCKIKDSVISSCFTALLPSEHDSLCLNYNLSNCKAKATDCSTRYVYDNSGILIGSSHNQDFL